MYILLMLMHMTIKQYIIDIIIFNTEQRTAEHRKPTATIYTRNPKYNVSTYNVEIAPTNSHRHKNRKFQSTGKSL